MNFPGSLKYTREHEWIKVIGSEALVGITEFASNELGDIVFVEIETVGENLKKGDIFGTIEAVKTVSDLFLPISGEILSINPILESTPEIVNKDPYGEGWLIKIKIENLSELDDLLTADDYIAMVE